MNFNRRDSMSVNTVFNKHHASDVNYSLRYTRWFLRLLGIWARVMSNPTAIEKNIAKILLPLSSIYMFSLVIPVCAHAILHRSDQSGLTKIFAPIVYQTTNIIKHFIMILRSETIKFCIQHMEMDWRRIVEPNDRDIMMRNVRVAHVLTILFSFCLYGSALMYTAILPLCSGNSINEFNETVRPLAYLGFDIFFDVQANVTYEIVFCSNFIAAFFHFTVNTALCNLAVIPVKHVCGQIQIVTWKIENLVDHSAGNDDNAIVNQIGVIVENHNRILRFATDVDQVLREIFLVEVMGTCVMICFVTYVAIVNWDNNDGVGTLTYGALGATFSLQLFVYCRIGEILTEQCQYIGKTAYMIEWYRLPGKTNLALVMIISMGNNPRKLTAAGIMELSNASFSSIMQTSFAYLNMMRRMA